MKTTFGITLLGSILCAAAAGADTRLPLQMDFDRCTLAVENHGQAHTLSGRVRLELLIRNTGEVYGAFVHSEQGTENRRLERCLTNAALLWKLPEVATDYQRPYVVTFVHGGTDIDFSQTSFGHGDHFAVPGRAATMMPDINDPAPVMAPDVEVAQETLDLSERASEAERGTAELAVGRTDRAIEAFRHALQQDSNDVVALRGLAHGLATKGGDLKEARSLAEKLVGIQPRSVNGREALLHVCLASGDDECAVTQFQAAKRADDLQPRSRMVAALQDGVRSAADRVRKTMAAAGRDPCAELAGEEAQALCVVKRCLDQGSADYARELSEQNHVSLAAGNWQAQRVAEGKYLVRRPIAGDGQRHDALWLVKVGEAVTMSPASSEARQITLRHNRCTARTLGSR